MSESKHTPGPWQTTEEFNCRIDITSDDGTVCEVMAFDGFKPGESGPANARLIAACPDLLAEVELFADIARIESPNTVLGGWDWKGIHERLTALLAKATG